VVHIIAQLWKIPRVSARHDGGYTEVTAKGRFDKHFFHIREYFPATLPYFLTYKFADD